MKKRSVFDFFPAPNFLKMPVVGLSLSDDAIRFVEYEHTLKGLRIKRFGEKAVPAEIMRSGHIENAQSFIEILKEFKKQHNLSFVRTALPEEKGYLFQTEVPIVSPREVRESIEFKIEENVPLSLSEVVFDYRVVKAWENKNYLEVVVCVLPVKFATMYADILKAAELVPLSLGIQSQVISQAVITQGDKRAILVLNLDKTTASFYIVNEGVVHFSSTITRGSQSLFSSFPEEAKETLKKDEKGKKYLPPSFHPEAAGVFRDTIKKFISYWDTYRGNIEGKEIEKIIMCGDGASNQEFLNFISSGVGVITHAGNVWANAFSFDDYIPSIPFEQSLLYAEASGLALPITD